MPERALPVSEIFGPTLQGEGSLAGQRTMFIRFAYCDGAGNQWCTWCDSMHAVDPKYKSEWEQMTPGGIVGRLLSLSEYCRNVTISGGNPLIHDLTELLGCLSDHSYIVNVETQGTIFKEWINTADIVTVSPKPPSAGVCNLERLKDFLNQVIQHRVVLKVVVDPHHEGDYEFARQILSERPTWYSKPRYLSVVTYPSDTRDAILERYQLLAERVMNDQDMPDVAVLPQLHVLLWGHRKEV
ncbi:hypothetical protein LCGC14_0938950 [marine sediment metagenome]|uniref:Radical SAM core domain-containing protein n=1 Tax=marine sediment metagenome TaxID=412755 RepID=A0A0F9P6T0_9ZZZZ